MQDTTAPPRNQEEVFASEKDLQLLENILGKKLNRSRKRKFDRSRKDILHFNRKPLWSVQEFWKCPDDYYFRLTKKQQHILRVIVQYCMNYRVCYVSYEKIAELSGCCWRTVASAVDLLRQDGVIGTLYRHNKTNFFRLSSDFRRQSVIDSLKKYIPVLKFVLSCSLLLSRIAPTACIAKNCIRNTEYNNKEVIFNAAPSAVPASNPQKSSSQFNSLSNLLQNVMKATPLLRPKSFVGQAEVRPPQVRLIEKKRNIRSLNGQQPKRKEMSVIKPPNEEYKRYSQKLKAQDVVPPAHRQYVHRPRNLPHEDIYVSYFKLQDHYKQNGNPLNLPNPYRAKFIEMIEQSCAESGISKTELKQAVYKMYLAKKEAGEI